MSSFFGKGTKYCNKTNVARIAQKIDELKLEKNCDPKEAWGYLSDILRLQLFCKTPEDVKELFDKLLKHDNYF